MARELEVGRLEEHMPLPVYTNECETVSCWRLTWAERLSVLVSGRLWLRQLNFGEKLQPQAPCIKTPFVKDISWTSSSSLSSR